jgi:uncharacterized protein (TIGR00251 family)
MHSSVPGTELCIDLAVRVIPRAKRDEVAGERDGRLLVRIAAPPVDGAANAAVCKLVAKLAGVPARRVSVVQGQTSRDKLLRIDGISELPPALRASA